VVTARSTIQSSVTSTGCPPMRPSNLDEAQAAKNRPPEIGSAGPRPLLSAIRGQRIRLLMFKRVAGRAPMVEKPASGA